MKRVLSRFKVIYQNRTEKRTNIFLKEPSRYYKIIVRNKNHTIIADENN
jgi:hypothetical protein